MISSEQLRQFFNPQTPTLENWANSGFGQAYNTGNWFSRTFDSGKLDMENSAYASAADRQFNYMMAQYTNAFNAAEAEKSWHRSEQSAKNQRDFEERMSNTQYERAVAQLRKLGINPYMVLQGLNGNVPQGSAGSSQAAGGASAYSSSKYSSVAARGSQELIRGLISLAGTAIGAATSAYTASIRPAPTRNYYYSRY